MNLTEHEIEWIVGEVVRRLQQQIAPPAVREPRDELRLPERVVTLATLRDKLHNIQHVIVPAKAVVSPAVRDELKQRGIRLSFAEATAAAKPVISQRSLLAVNWASDYRTEILARLAASYDTTLEYQSTSNDAQQIQNQAVRVSQQQALAVWFTSEPAKLLCLANRQANIWAVEGTSPEGLKQTLRSVTANVLVIDPRQKSQYLLNGLIRNFVGQVSNLS